MKINSQYLYDLLPAYYRKVDEETGGALRALLEILAREGRIVEEQIDQLYDNWFIETCEEWVVPYIGDLLGVKGIHEIADAAVYSQRAYIANTLTYRRRKGTTPVLEQLALDVTGWRAKAVEIFRLLGTSQNVDHIRLSNQATADLRDMNALDLINTPFDTQSHNIDVGRISTGEGLFNIHNIGIFLWRLQSYPMGDKNTQPGEVPEKVLHFVDARKIEPDDQIPEGCYTFHPLGFDTHLMNHPQTEHDIVNLAEEYHVPALLRRRALYDELEVARKADVNNRTPEYRYFDKNYPPVFQIFINGQVTPIPNQEILICSLSEWRRPPSEKIYLKYETDGSVTEVIKPISAAVDPVLGRVSFADPIPETPVLVNYNYGFSGDIGGGPYDRAVSLDNLTNIDFDWQRGVSKDCTPIPGEIHDTLAGAISEWNASSGQVRSGLIIIMDNRSYDEMDTLPAIEIQEGAQLYIIAAGWPETVFPGGGSGRINGMFQAEDRRPHIRGDLDVKGLAAPGPSNGGKLVINGLLIEGKITALAGNLGSLYINHCTLAPGKGGLIVENQDPPPQVFLQHTICGPINIMPKGALLCIDTCIIDDKAGETPAISVSHGQLAIEKSTIWGTVHAQSLDAGNSLFMNRLDIPRRQIGCVRFSYVPPGSRIPRKYRCQPEEESQTGKIWTPVFNADTYGHHAYAQLGVDTPPQITAGAENGSEMGVFNYLQQAQREANLKIALEEYLRLGLEAGIIYVT